MPFIVAEYEHNVITPILHMKIYDNTVYKLEYLNPNVTPHMNLNQLYSLSPRWQEK